MVVNSQTLEKMLFALGILLLLVAAHFTRVASRPERSSTGNIAFPSNDAGCGFAIAAGLCFVSAAIIDTKRPA